MQTKYGGSAKCFRSLRCDSIKRYSNRPIPIINRQTQLNIFYVILIYEVDVGGLVVSVLATGPKVRGFDPERGRWIFKGDKNP
jgi:hypothetical protein